MSISTSPQNNFLPIKELLGRNGLATDSIGTVAKQTK